MYFHFSISDPRVSSFFHEYIQEVYQENVALPIVVIATTSHTKLLSPPLYEGFLHEIKQQVITVIVWLSTWNLYLTYSRF